MRARGADGGMNVKERVIVNSSDLSIREINNELHPFPSFDTPSQIDVRVAMKSFPQSDPANDSSMSSTGIVSFHR